MGKRGSRTTIVILLPMREDSDPRHVIMQMLDDEGMAIEPMRKWVWGEGSDATVIGRLVYHAFVQELIQIPRTG